MEVGSEHRARGVQAELQAQVTDEVNRWLAADASLQMVGLAGEFAGWWIGRLTGQCCM